MFANHRNNFHFILPFGALLLVTAAAGAAAASFLFFWFAVEIEEAAAASDVSKLSGPITYLTLQQHTCMLTTLQYLHLNG